MNVPQVAKKQSFTNLAQGEYLVSADPNLCLTTLLGSCVATCIWDKRRNIGGMNHYLLPGHVGGDETLLRYGVNAMELLINGLLKTGSHKSDLQAKIFGGAQMLNSSSQIGAVNGAFALEFLQAEGIELVGQSLGGRRGRRLRFFPTTGRAQQRFMASDDFVGKPPVTTTASVKKPAGDLELF